jgi:hypothetical protein
MNKPQLPFNDTREPAVVQPTDVMPGREDELDAE